VDVIEARALAKTYGAGEAAVTALACVDLQIAPGESVAVTGRSGSGKSTLLHLIAGIDRPTGGQVLVQGTDLATLDDDQRTLFRRTRIGLVFQSFNLLNNFTAQENVAMPLLLGGASAAEANRRAAAALERVGLAQRRTHLPSRMSGGEQQRTAVARALVIDPVVLLADEPAGNLDSENARAIIDLIYGLGRDKRATVVIVTHDPAVASAAGRVIHLVDGRARPAGTGK
jgi:putative ABC transport system ATP-binding protein